MTQDPIDPELHTRIAAGLISVGEVKDLLQQVKDARNELRAAKGGLDDAARAIQSLQGQLARAQTELSEKTAALRAIDPVDAARRITEAYAVGRAEAEAAYLQELAGLRSDVGRLQSEVSALQLSKRKLRDALERTKGSR